MPRGSEPQDDLRVSDGTLITLARERAELLAALSAIVERLDAYGALDTDDGRQDINNAWDVIAKVQS